MKNNHRLLKWLTLEQALDSLSRLTKEPISEEDLVGLCEEGNCGAFVRIDFCEGEALDALAGDSGEWTVQVYGVGYQRLSSPRALWANRKEESISAQLCGAVRTVPEAEAEVVGDVIWKTSIPAHSQPLYFKHTDIVHLAAQITGNDELDARERTSVGRLIAILADLAKLDIDKTSKAAGILIKHAASVGMEPPNKDTIAKFLKLALEKSSTCE